MKIMRGLLGLYRCAIGRNYDLAVLKDEELV